MIEKTIENWHSFLRGDLELDDLLHEECVFLSPVVFKPLKGRELTKLYLNAAYKVFPGDEDNQENNDSSTDSGSFNYTKYILDGNIGTCGGAMAAFDLSLSIIREINGVTVALDVASMFLSGTDLPQEYKKNIVYKKKREGRNPKTKETKMISSRDVVLFKPSKEFKDFVNLKDNG